MFAVAAVVSATAPLFVLILFSASNRIWADCGCGERMSTVHDLNKKILKPLLNEFRQGNPEGIKQQLKQLVSPSAPIRLGEPFDEITGPEALWEEVYEPLYSSFRI